MPGQGTSGWGPPTGRNYPCLVNTQRFMTESYEKETDSRVRWYFRNLKGRKSEEGAGKGSQQYEVFKKRLLAGCPKPAEGVFAKLRDRKPADYRMRVVEGDDFWVKLMDKTKADAHLLQPMYPVDKATRDLLYEGVSKQDQGRALYLHERYRKQPEFKYKFPLTNSFDHGWRLGDVIKKDELRHSEHVRKSVVEQTFFSRNGLPELDQSVACKCFLYSTL